MSAQSPDTVAVAACPVCRNGERERLHAGLHDLAFGVAGGSWALWRCRGCGSAYLDPRPADAGLADLYALYYTHGAPAPNLTPAGVTASAARSLRNGHLNRALGYRLQPAWWAGALLGRAVPPFGAVAERAVRRLPFGARVLDVGCGNGLFVAEACAWGLRASGIDLDEAAVAAGRAAGLDVAVETPAARAAREPGAYDAVTLSHVIEHVPDPIELLRCCARLLRVGGILWIATPNLAAAGHRRFGRAWLHLDPPRHLVLFDARSLTTAVAAAGLIEPQVVRPVPNAVRSYTASATIARGVVAGASPPPPGRRVKLTAVLADVRAQVRPQSAEELVLVARRPER